MNREDILHLETPPACIQSEWWGECHVRYLLASDFEMILDIFDKYDGHQRLIALVIVGLVDKENNQVLRMSDMAKLEKGPLEPITTLSTAFLNINGLEEPDLEKKSSPPLPTSPTVSLMSSANPSQNR